MTETMTEIAIKKALEENKRSIATYIYKYSDYKTATAVKELSKIDLVKNNVKTSTLYNYVSSVREFIKTGKKARLTPEYVYETAQFLMDKHYARLTPPKDEAYSPRGKGKVKVEGEEKSIENIGVVTSPIKMSSQSVTDLTRVRNKLELESATIQNALAKLQKRASSVAEKIKAVSVVMDLLK